MNIAMDDLISWLIVGALAGSLAGMLVKGRKEGFGHILNLGVGLFGALLGGLIFKMLQINLGLLGSIRVSLSELLVGFLGALLLLAIIWGLQKKWPWIAGISQRPISK